MEIVARQQPVAPSRLTSISPIRSSSLPMRPGPTLPTHHFRIGAEVFLINPATGNNILFANGSSIGTGFDTVTTIPVACAPLQLSWTKVSFEASNDYLTPSHCDSSGVFLVLRRLIKLPFSRNLMPDGVHFNANTGDLGRGEYVYHITPKTGVGKEKLVSATRLVEMRFCPLDWVWYSPCKGPVGSRNADAEDAARQSKEKAMVIGAEVLSGSMMYHVHLVNRCEDRVMVPDERLEKILHD